MEAVDPATENSICEAGMMRKQDQNDSAKFHEKNCHVIEKKRFSADCGSSFYLHVAGWVVTAPAASVLTALSCASQHS